MPDSTESAVPTANRAVGIVMRTCHNLPLVERTVFHRRCSDAQEPASSHAPSARAHRPVDPHLAAAQGLTAEQVADRAGISRPTLRTIETHPERASFGNVMAVLAVLGVDEAITTAIDPLESERGRALVLARLEPGARP